MDRIDKSNLPRHIAIIMDGNGRCRTTPWGGLPVTGKGPNRSGTSSSPAEKSGSPISPCTRSHRKTGAARREKSGALMTLLERYLKSEVKVMLKNNIRLLAIGDTGALPEKVRTILRDTIEETAGNTAMTLVLALNYGSHDEILGAVRKLIDEARQGNITASDVTLERFAGYLFKHEASRTRIC